MSAIPSNASLKQLIRQHLMNDTDVEGLAGSRIYGAHPEDTEVGTIMSQGPIVIFEFLSGNTRWHGGVAVQTMDIYAYSKRSSDESTQLYDAVATALHQECLKITGIDVVAVSRETQRPVDGYNNVVKGWYHRGRFSMEVI